MHSQFGRVGVSGPNVLVLDVIPATVHVKPVGRLGVERPQAHENGSQWKQDAYSGGGAELSRPMPQNVPLSCVRRLMGRTTSTRSHRRVGTQAITHKRVEQLQQLDTFNSALHLRVSRVSSAPSHMIGGSTWLKIDSFIQFQTRSAPRRFASVGRYGSMIPLATAALETLGDSTNPHETACNV